MSDYSLREEFEAWYLEEQFKMFSNTEMQASRVFFLAKEVMWVGWQASRAAVVIELPKGMTIFEHMYGVPPHPEHERWFPRHSAVKAIEFAGLKVKPLPPSGSSSPCSWAAM